MAVVNWISVKKKKKHEVVSEMRERTHVVDIYTAVCASEQISCSPQYVDMYVKNMWQNQGLYDPDFVSLYRRPLQAKAVFAEPQIKHFVLFSQNKCKWQMNDVKHTVQPLTVCTFTTLSSEFLHLHSTAQHEQIRALIIKHNVYLQCPLITAKVSGTIG